MQYRLCLALLALLAMGCGSAAERRGSTILFASGADLQSSNPLVTIHPLAKQVQRYVLLATLARYDSALVPQPYLAQSWDWSDDNRRLTLNLTTSLNWHDGTPTTAEDVRFTLEAARDPLTGYPRMADLTGVNRILAPDDSTAVLEFSLPQQTFPDVLTDLAIVPAHHLDTVPRDRLRQAQWNQQPVGNGPFIFVSYEPNRRWVFAANPDFPEELGGPPRLSRFIVVVVDEPTTKLAALTAEELDFAGIQPAHADFVRRDRRLDVLDYPLLFTYGVVFNTRRAPFDDRSARRAVSLALDRQEIVDGYLYGFGSAAFGPVPPGVPGAAPAPPVPMNRDSARRLLGERQPDVELLTVGSGEAALEQMIQAQLEQVGFDVRIRQIELSAFLDRVYGRQHDFQAAVMGIPGDLALGYLGPLLELTGMTAPADPDKLQEVFLDDVPVAFVYTARGVQGANRRVRGVKMDLRGELSTVAEWWVEP
jgi:peptide/nickel transport system substrate-binding protein